MVSEVQRHKALRSTRPRFMLDFADGPACETQEGYRASEEGAPEPDLAGRRLEAKTHVKPGKHEEGGGWKVEGAPTPRSLSDFQLSDLLLPPL